jgi:predicted RNA-binding Zn-ribbon protein involved in translation (DUF1610 family)
VANIRCPIGHVFSDGEVPSRFLHRMIADTHIESVVNKILKAIESGGDLETQLTFELLSAGVLTYQCPECGRLLVFWNGEGRESTSYLCEAVPKG